MSSMKSRNRGERGTALIEFALVLPFVICLTFAVIDLSRAFFVKNVLYQAAREGVRTAVVVTAADADVVQARVRQVMSAANVPVSSIVIGAPVDRQISVTVSSSFNWLFPGVFNWTGAGFASSTTLQATAWMRKETP
jgi:Flp pilus assembly protein TadG